MSGIPEATAINLSTEERAELEGLARSTKTEHRLRQRARIVLFAADGMASQGLFPIQLPPSKMGIPRPI